MIYYFFPENLVMPKIPSVRSTKCLACSGSGVSSKGFQCLACNGTGRKLGVKGGS